MKPKDLVKQAIDKKYVDFDRTTKDILAHKVAQKLDQDGYFKKLDQARGISEAKGDVYVQVVDGDGNAAKIAEGPAKDLEKLFKQAIKNAQGLDWSYEKPYFEWPDEVEKEAERLEKKYNKELKKLD